MTEGNLENVCSKRASINLSVVGEAQKVDGTGPNHMEKSCGGLMQHLA